MYLYIPAFAKIAASALIRSGIFFKFACSVTVFGNGVR